MLCGHSAKVGVELAFFAQIGIEAPVNILERKNGFFDLFKPDQPDFRIISSLGSKWRLQEPGILTKSYPVCSAALAGAEQICHLKRKHDLNFKDIKSITVEVSELVSLSLGSFDNPQSTRESQFSIPFIMACGLYFGDLGLEHLTLKNLNNKEIRALMQKVNWSVNPEFSGKKFSIHAPECYRICLKLVNEQEITGFQGMATKMSDSQLAEKFISCTQFGGSNFEQAEKALDILSVKKGQKQQHTIQSAICNLF